MMPEYKESVGKRIGRFIVLIGIVFALSAGVIVTQRLSQDSLALLVGLSCGVAAMLPTLGVFVLWLRREDTRRHKYQTQLPTQTQPQVIVVAPPAFPGYNPGYPTGTQTALPAQWQTAAPEREFKIVGGTD